MGEGAYKGGGFLKKMTFTGGVLLERGVKRETGLNIKIDLKSRAVHCDFI